MPSLSQKIVISGTKYDRRCKISDETKEQVRLIRRNKHISYQKIADMFGINKTSVQFICNPQSYEDSKRKYRERAADGRYHKTKEKAAEVQREHRKYKQQLYVQNKIKLCSQA